MKPRFLLLLMALATVMMCGCVQETVDGPKRIYTNELWVPLSLLFGGLAAGALGWVLRKTIERLAWALMIGGPIAALGFAPSAFLDRVVVDETSYSVRTGFWMMPNKHEVKYEDLAKVQVTVETSRGRRGRQNVNYYMVCERKDGTSEKISLGHDVVEESAPYFRAIVEAHGVKFLL